VGEGQQPKGGPAGQQGRQSLPRLQSVNSRCELVKALPRLSPCLLRLVVPVSASAGPPWLEASGAMMEQGRLWRPERRLCVSCGLVLFAGAGSVHHVLFGPGWGLGAPALCLWRQGGRGHVRRAAGVNCLRGRHTTAPPPTRARHVRVVA
jgi:hypothetical protein